MFYQKLFQKCCMEIHVKIDIDVHFICTKYTWDLIKKMYIHYLSFHEGNALKEQNKKKCTSFFLNNIKEYRNSSFR